MTQRSSGPLVFLYDAFPAAPFGGNVAGVVLVEPPTSSWWLQQVAAELAAPTTGFVDLPSARTGEATVRFFTPLQEIDACGHVTVALATCLVDVGLWPVSGVSEPAVTAPGGRWPLQLHRRDRELLVEMRQRLIAPPVEPGDLDLAPLLGPVRPSERIPVLLAGTGLRHLLVPVQTTRDLSALPLDARGIVAVSAQAGVDTVGVFTVTAAGDTAVRARMRDLCAGIGAVEEPASGTTSATLAFCLAYMGMLRPGCEELTVEMGVEMGRPSRLLVRMDFEERQPSMARLLGSARRVLAGRLEPPASPTSPCA
jgi:trans-2,3-dihydro-3-hydroxyanthranilate isomerase